MVFVAANSSALAVIARLLAICGTGTTPHSGLRAILSRRGTIRSGTLTVAGPPPRDLPARIVYLGSVARRPLAVTLGADLIALDSC